MVSEQSRTEVLKILSEKIESLGEDEACAAEKVATFGDRRRQRIERTSLMAIYHVSTS